MIGNNMFAYCNNCPANYTDSYGEYPVLAGIVSNIINAIYYEFSDGESDLSSDSYSNNSGEKVTRWNKLDYVKQETQEEHYNANAWRYYNEYTVHEYGWYVTGWADEKEIAVVSWLADRFEVADVFPNAWDERWYVNAATILLGILGL